MLIWLDIKAWLESNIIAILSLTKVTLFAYKSVQQELSVEVGIRLFLYKIFGLQWQAEDQSNFVIHF